MNLLKFVLIGGLATWRLASLLANEAGAFRMFERARRYAARLTKHNRFWRAFDLYEGVQCEWCNSVWFGALLTVLYRPAEPLLYFLLPLALSTVAIVVKYIVQGLVAIKEHYELMNAMGTGGYHPVQMPEHSFLMEK